VEELAVGRLMMQVPGSERMQSPSRAEGGMKVQSSNYTSGEQRRRKKGVFGPRKEDIHR
jgi:hypothetical protein